jgi:hypothetical protein
LPQDLCQDDLLEVLDKLGFGGFYDFVFMPPAFGTQTTQGRALVNFVNHRAALSFASRFAVMDLAGVAAARAPEAQWSLPLQGLDALVARYRVHPANFEGSLCKPLVFHGGFLVPFVNE